MPHEFYQIMVGAPTMTLSGWKQLARWSIEYSCLAPEQKAKGQLLLEQSWKHFCEGVVTRYGNLMDKDGVTINKAAADAEYKKMLNTNTGKLAKGKPTYDTLPTGETTTKA